MDQNQASPSPRLQKKIVLQYSYFSIGGALFHQVRGCCIGNPLSPMLCDGAILANEIKWPTNHANILPVRYVDNLAGFSTQSEFLGWDPSFYHQPISLETCPIHQFFLGCNLSMSPTGLSCEYMVNQERWRYCHIRGAGSSNRLLTGFFSRISAAYSLSFPTSSKHLAILKLGKLYLELGFAEQPIIEGIRKLAPGII